MVRFTRFGSNLVDHGPFYQISVQFGQSRSVLPDWGPIWSFTVCFTRFGSNLMNHGPDHQFLVRFGRLRSVLLVLGPSRSITVHFTIFGSNFDDNGPFLFVISFLFLILSVLQTENLSSGFRSKIQKNILSFI